MVNQTNNPRGKCDGELLKGCARRNSITFPAILQRQASNNASRPFSTEEGLDVNAK
jgi:hypothetical protein